VLKLLGFDAHNIFNTKPSGFRWFFDGLLHHVLGHRLCQSAALLLQMAADSLLQLGYLCLS
jgi:hypothetical protein